MYNMSIQTPDAPTNPTPDHQPALPTPETDHLNIAIHNAVKAALDAQGIVDPLAERAQHADRVVAHGPVPAKASQRVRPGRLRFNNLDTQK